MRVLKSLALSLVSLVLVALPVHAAETIQSFDVGAELLQNRTLTVTETITYDFGDALRHGIYRTIPTVYDRHGGRYNLRLHVTEVMVDGHATPWSTSHSGDLLSIKIGDADKTLTGRHVYSLRYETDRAINTFDEGVEWYWNVTGNDWEIPIAFAAVRFTGPASPTDVVCFTGPFGSEEHGCTTEIDRTMISIATQRPLDPYEGLTVAIRLPSGSILPLTTWQSARHFLEDNLALLTPLLVFILMFFLWRAYGKEPSGRGTIIAQYDEPHGLPPAMLTSLIDQSMSLRSVTATILDLARRGFLALEFEGDPGKKSWFGKKTSYTFIKEKPLDEKVFAYERTLFDGLFRTSDRVKMDALKGTFWKEIQKARSQVFDALKEEGFFERRPEVVRGIWVMVAVATGFAHALLIGAFGPLMIASGVLSGLIVVAFGWQMPRKTEAGSLLREEALGFKEFLSVTEKDRLAFTDAPARRPEQFARFLPAAVAFGVEEEWAKQFEGIDIQPPSYIHGTMNGWTALQFASLSDSFHHASASSAFVAPSSAGSGSSGFSGGGGGGGFGGGGGGSW